MSGLAEWIARVISPLEGEMGGSPEGGVKEHEHLVMTAVWEGGGGGSAASAEGEQTYIVPPQVLVSVL
jgi:hypothetical protein